MPKEKCRGAKRVTSTIRQGKRAGEKKTMKQRGIMSRLDAIKLGDFESGDTLTNGPAKKPNFSQDMKNIKKRKKKKIVVTKIR